jgi:hypothetical protein
MRTIPAETGNRTHLLCFANNILLFYSSSLYSPAAAVFEPSILILILSLSQMFYHSANTSDLVLP